MIKLFLKKHILKSKILLLREAGAMHECMLLFIKLGSTRTEWTIDEIFRFKSNIKHLALCGTPIIIMLVIPFGFLVLPFYIEFLDRREKSKIIT